jgi:hypothetical protein
MANKKKEDPHCRVSRNGSTDFVGLPTALRLESKLLVLAMPVHGAQFNGKQEGQAISAHLTCAAPATVSRRFFAHAKNQLSSQTTGRPETGGWEGDEGRSVSPDTGQQGDLSQDRL